jgi:tetratricopeptide (TPR) repeat protein
VLAVLAAVMVAAGHVRQRYQEPREAFRAGQELVRQEQHGRALEVLEHGRRLASALPFTGEVRQALDEQLEAARAGEARARRRQQARELHELAERIRFASVADPLPAEQARALEAPCRALWEARERILGGPDAPEELRTDLLDVAVIGASLRVRLAPPDGEAEARREAVRILDEAGALFGPSPALEQERAALEGEAPPDRAEPRTAWEHVTVGRTLLQAGRAEDAARHFASAIDRAPGRFWPHFYLGLCAYRLGRSEEAVREFSVCAALSPDTAACYYNRALARMRARPPEHAEAHRDLQNALRRGADPAAVHYQMALIHLAEKDRDAARASLRRALEHDAGHAEARALFDRLGREP